MSERPWKWWYRNETAWYASEPRSRAKLWQQGQNTQLWKLIEKQRAQSAHLNAENERLRSDRDRANGKLAAAGLDPIHGKRIPNSASAVGLSLRPEPPQIRRHDSDRGEKTPKPTLQVPTSDTSNFASPVDGPDPNGLLPSPMTEAKLRRESRMNFPPEVTSFMTLAESPRDLVHNFPPTIAKSSSQTTLSPASQYSPSPSQQGREDIGARVAPASSRALAVTTEEEEDGEGEDGDDVTGEWVPRRKGSDTMAPPRKLSLSPEDVKNGMMPQVSPVEELPRSPYDTNLPRPSQDFESIRASLDSSPLPDIQKTSANPITPLSAVLLPHTRLMIPTSTVQPNAFGRDVLSFIVSITVRPPNGQESSWNVAKLFSAFVDLDTNIKSRSGKGRKEWKSIVAPLPEGRAWKEFAPSKIDQRRKAIEAYLQSLLVAPISDKSVLCDFLSTDAVQTKMEGQRKEGYLTKKGKNFGGWKRRFFVLDGPVMRYYEMVGPDPALKLTVTAWWNSTWLDRHHSRADWAAKSSFRLC